ncbi:MAG: DUF4342 domain-containing protein [Lachnospiraceae bacterium]|nr:DUF4342 domain-containing protein [Lachnospiraceae bacterium]
MEKLEKVEKIREKTGVSYEDAYNALAESSWDILDALVLLERQGKIKEPERSTYSTREESESFRDASESYEESSRRMSRKERSHVIKGKLKRLFRKSCDNYFLVEKGDRVIMEVPLLVMVVVLIAAFWALAIALVAGLFCGFRYSFRGEIAENVDVNGACDRAAEMCENVRKEFEEL